MPTFAKVTAAVFFAALGYFCADLIKPLLPMGTPAVWLNETLAALGAINGWIMSGKRAGDGTRAGIGYGLTTAALIVVWGGVHIRRRRDDRAVHCAPLWRADRGHTGDGGDRA